MNITNVEYTVRELMKVTLKFNSKPHNFKVPLSRYLALPRRSLMRVSITGCVTW